MNFHWNADAKKTIRGKIHGNACSERWFNIIPITYCSSDNSRDFYWANRSIRPTVNIDYDETYEKYDRDFPFGHESLFLNDSCRRGGAQVFFVLKYSPSTALTASGTVSSFLAFLSASNALSMSSDTETIIFFITGHGVRWSDHRRQSWNPSRR